MIEGPQKGFPWPKQVPAYHATTALDAVLREGLKSRRELTGDLRHATGGGPEESVSFTLDIRVARAICAGLRTLALCAKRAMSTGELVLAMDELAPSQALKAREETKLDNETVLRLDEGLYGIHAGMSWGPRYSVNMKSEGWDDVDRFEQLDREGLVVDVDYRYAGNATKPFEANGWVPLEMAAELSDDRTAENLAAQPWCYELYQQFLLYGKVLYNPVFFMTSMESLASLDVEQIGIVEARIDADWLCADMKDIKSLGYSMDGLSLSYDWSYACQNRLRRQSSGDDDVLAVRSKPSREWESPDAWDTVYYTASMAEVRVYDTSLIRDIEMREGLDDVLHELSIDWWNKGVKDVEEPIAAPYFKAQRYSLRERGYLI